MNFRKLSQRPCGVFNAKCRQKLPFSLECCSSYIMVSSPPIDPWFLSSDCLGLCFKSIVRNLFIKPFWILILCGYKSFFHFMKHFPIRHGVPYSIQKDCLHQSFLLILEGFAWKLRLTPLFILIVYQVIYMPCFGFLSIVMPQKYRPPSSACIPYVNFRLGYQKRIFWKEQSYVLLIYWKQVVHITKEFCVYSFECSFKFLLP